MLNVSKDEKGVISPFLTKRGLIKSRWFQQKFKPLFKKHLKGYRFLGVFIDNSRSGLFYDFRFDTPKTDELNLEIDKESGDIIHVTMNGDVNLLSREDLKSGHVSDLEEIILTFKNHIEQQTNKRLKISSSEMKKIISEEAIRERDDYFEKLKETLETLEYAQKKERLSELLEVDSGTLRVKRDNLGLPLLKERGNE